MAITILKNSQKPKTSVPAQKVVVSELATFIDVVGEQTGDAVAKLVKIKALQEELKPYLANFKKLNGMIDAIQDYDADAEFTERGLKYQCDAGKREKTRSIKDLAGIEKKLGRALFLQVAKITLADVDKYISQVEQTKLDLITVARTTRKINVVPIRE